MLCNRIDGGHVADMSVHHKFCGIHMIFQLHFLYS